MDSAEGFTNHWIQWILVLRPLPIWEDSMKKLLLSAFLGSFAFTAFAVESHKEAKKECKMECCAKNKIACKDCKECKAKMKETKKS